MIILNTNVISEPTKLSGDTRVSDWLNRQDIQSLFITSINLAELMAGVATLPEGRRKQALRNALNRFLVKRIVTPILPFDREAAMAYATVAAHAKAKRYTLPVADAQIAAIARVHGFAVATRDVQPFLAAGVAVVNPWTDE